MTRWTREPLVHFLVLGAALFALATVVGDAGGAAERRIVVTAQDIEWLRSAWERQWRRPPTEQELQSLIDNHVREEILYRQAMEMGLDENDTIIRRRLVQKLEFLTEDLVDQLEPSEEEVRRHFETHPDDFRRPELRSFTHIYFSVDRRGDAAWADAERLVAELAAMTPSPERAPELGDRFMMQYDYPRRDRSDVARHMGEEFAAALFAVEPGGWEGPLRSGYGVHLVRIWEVFPSTLPALAEVEEAVREDLMRRRRESANETFYEGLLSKYDVVIEDAA